jgi:CDP-diacylglycerol--serine O-phosphatidyltransferase
MLGYYNYTVYLTYLSLVSAGTGIVVSMSGMGHPYLGVFFLLLCGLCDAFDGKVARTKTDRSEQEEKFGIQIDSLSDLVAFGVLPACIGFAMLRRSSLLQNTVLPSLSPILQVLLNGVLGAILILYILASMIRLAYFNVTEEERQKTEGGTRKFYTGLPVTSAALIFPTVMLLQYIISYDVTPLYFVITLTTGRLFLSKIQIKKPGLRGILIMVLIGAVEFAFILLFHWLKTR